MFNKFAKLIALVMIISPVIVLFAAKAFEIHIAKASSNSENFADFCFCLVVLEPVSSIFNHFSLSFNISQTVFFLCRTSGQFLLESLTDFLVEGNINLSFPERLKPFFFLLGRCCSRFSFLTHYWLKELPEMMSYAVNQKSEIKYG